MLAIRTRRKNIDIKKAISTSAAIGLAIAIAGTLGFSGWGTTGQHPNSVGFMQVPVFLVISLSSILAALQGARLATRLPGHYLKRIFAVVSFLLSVKMLYSVIFV